MELGQTLGYEGEDFKKYVAQCIEDERAQKEADRSLEREKATIAAENETKKAKIKADRETEKAKIEAAKIEAEKMTAENERLKIEAKKEIKMAKISAQRESETEARQNEIEAKRLEIENQLQVRRLESEVQIRTSSSEDSIEHRGINCGIKTLKLPTFNEDKDNLDAYLNRSNVHVRRTRLSRRTGRYN